MKKLPKIRARGEQLPLISLNRLGVEVVCGAAGSGKTSTALLRLRSLCYMSIERHQRMGNTAPVKVLVLTFNRTLAGYVSALAESQIDPGLPVELEISTFGKWAMERLGRPTVLDDRATKRYLLDLASRIEPLAPDYVVSEVEYLMGRFQPDRLDDYLTFERTGRGVVPRVNRALRQRILDEVVRPYQSWLHEQGAMDWNLLAVAMEQNIAPLCYDVVVLDESQDFSANQLRAVRHHLAPEHAATFVIDTVQRIYARGFTWSEVGFDIRPERYHRLAINHRNTAETAAFAAGVLNGINVDGDGALPNLTAAEASGPLPIVLKGLYQRQVAWAIEFIQNNVNLKSDSVAFLKPQGGAWFEFLKGKLAGHGVEYVEITRESVWPEGSANIALSTFHSAKGLEFDYVFILGLSDQSTRHGDEERDDKLWVLRRLLAVAIARARKQVVIGYKPGEESDLVQHFVPGTFQEQAL